MATTREASNGGLLRWIAVFKFAKAVLLVAAAISAFKLSGNGQRSRLEDWISGLGLFSGRHFIDVSVGKLVNLSPDRLKALGIGSFIYAALFLTEGTGLWLQKRWGEWTTIVITASLLPLEIYEIIREISAAKIAVLLVNIAVVIYLVARVRREKAPA